MYTCWVIPGRSGGSSGLGTSTRCRTSASTSRISFQVACSGPESGSFRPDFAARTWASVSHLVAASWAVEIVVQPMTGFLDTLECGGRVLFGVDDTAEGLPEAGLDPEGARHRLDCRRDPLSKSFEPAVTDACP